MANDAEKADRKAARQDAETKKLLAEADLAQEQLIAAKIERRTTEARAREAEVDARLHEMNLDVAERDMKWRLATDEEARVFQFDGPVGASSVKTCISTLSRWARLTPECDIEIVFNSPGGSVIDGFALWDFLTSLKSAGHKLTTVCRGMAASMAGILLQAGDVRVIGSESVLLIHEISFGAGGKIGEVEDEVAFAKMLTQRVLRIFEKRSNLSAAQIDRRWKRKDWWLDSDEALKLGFADEIR